MPLFLLCKMSAGPDGSTRSCWTPRAYGETGPMGPPGPTGSLGPMGPRGLMGTQQEGRIATRQGSNGDYYGVIRGAAAVGTIGLILEHSFHTNTRATNWLMKESNLARLAEEEAIVIAEYFDVLESKTPVEVDVLYRVQAGAFRSKAYAEAHLSRIKSAGFDAYITGSGEDGSLYRVQACAFRVKSNAEAYLAEIKASGFDAYIAT